MITDAMTTDAMTTDAMIANAMIISNVMTISERTTAANVLSLMYSKDSKAQLLRLPSKI
jgi:hypothetical protein